MEQDLMFLIFSTVHLTEMNDIAVRRDFTAAGKLDKCCVVKSLCYYT